MPKKKSGPVSHAGWLVFIDTNILLDFYRARGSESLSVLDHLENNYDKIITGSQVEMEFKKNRQAAIIDAHSRIKSPDFKDVRSLPAFLSESKQKSGIGTSEKQISTMVKSLRKRTERLLLNPSKCDPVYQRVQRLFRADSPHNLTREDKIRHEIKENAVKRWRLGYPPRKDKDTSIGDAVNWEWIIHCASESKKHIVIVSRDSDFGTSFGKETVLNDWLAEEFHSRVAKTRKIILTNRLTMAFDRAGIKVTKKEERVDDELLASVKKPLRISEAEASEFVSRQDDREYLRSLPEDRREALILLYGDS